MLRGFTVALADGGTWVPPPGCLSRLLAIPVQDDPGPPWLPSSNISH